MVVKNYTGDRLNFGIAAETATARFGIPVETVYVADDVALGDDVSPRGVAGTLAVHKVAGALAASGARLAAVASGARAAAARVKTMGVAYEICSLPGRPPSTRLGAGEIELGLGIHGEPGAKKCATLDATAVAEALAEATTAKVPEGARVALVVNGATQGCFNCTSTLECLSDRKGVKKNASTLRETLRRDDHLGPNNEL